MQLRNLDCAAYAAGHASEGRGLDAHVLADAGRQGWRDQAYKWLADDIAPLRTKELLARLTEADRERWTQLWDEIRDLHEHTAE